MRWKIHAAVIGVITAVFFIGYLLFSPTPKTPEQMAVINTSGIRMQIEQASWGLKCNELYDAYKKRADADAQSDKPPSENPNYSPPVLIQANNVLTKVKELCEGKDTCDITASSDVLGNVFSDCSKDLEVSWRCFSYDRLQSGKASNGNVLSITCKKP